MDGVVDNDAAVEFEPFPLADLPSAYWVGRSASGLGLSGTACHIMFEFEEAAYDVPRLERALQHVIRRHKMLRCVVTEDGMNQVLRSVPPYRIAVTDQSHLDDAAFAAWRDAEWVRMMRRVFNAAEWPLFEVRVVATRDRQWLLCDFDHMTMDLRSMFIVFQEWDAVYAGRGDTLPPVPRFTYRQAVERMVAQRDTPRYARDKEYWFSRIDSLPGAPPLPLTQPLSGVQAPTFRRIQHFMSKTEWAQVKAVARRFHVTPTLVMLTTFANVLAASSNSDHFIVNISMFNLLNIHRDAARVVGDFTVTVLLEVDLRDTLSFLAMVQRMQDRFVNDMDHALVSGLTVVRERMRRLTMAGDDTAAALCPVVFTSELSVEANSDGSQLGTLGRNLSATPQVILDVGCTLADEGRVCVTWDYVEEVFPAGLPAAMMESYLATVAALSDAAAWERDSFRVALPRSHLQLAAQINGQPSVYDGPCPPTLFALFDAQARAVPHNTAVACPDSTDGITQLSYLELYGRAAQLGVTLAALGARADQLVAVYMRKGWAQIVAALGTLHAGAAYMPINHEDPEARVAGLLEAGRCAILVTTEDMASRLPASAVAAVTVVLVSAQSCYLASGRDAGVVPDLDTTTRVLSTRPAARCEPDSLAYVIFTSGSTGKPKGVMVQHDSAVNTVIDIHFRCGMQPSDKVVALHKFNFDLSVWDTFGTLTAGATLVMPADGRVKDMQYVAELCASQGVTVWNSVPTWVAMLLEFAEGREVLRRCCLRMIMMSGDAIPADLPPRIQQVLAVQAGPDGAPLPPVTVMGLGGPTEDTIWCMAFPFTERDPSWSLLPYGTPLRQMQVHVLDKHLRPLPAHAVGEICFSGVGVARGYWGDPELTAARFPVDPATGTRYHRSGDLGRLSPAGYVEILGRMDSQVKINGYRVELGEVTAALRSHPAVTQAVVIYEAGKLHAFVEAKARTPAPASVRGAAAAAAERRPITSEAEKAVFKLEQRNLRSQDDLAAAATRVVSIPLPPVVRTGDAQALHPWQRASCRTFSASPLDLSQLSDPLRACAVTLEEANPDGDVRLYVVATNIDGCTRGVYIADMDDDEMELDFHAPLGTHRDPLHVAANQGWTDGAAATLMLVSGHLQPWGAPSGTMCDSAEATALMTAVGEAVEALSKAAHESGVGLCVTAGVDPDSARSRLQLMPGMEVVMCAVVGVPAESPQLDLEVAVAPAEVAVAPVSAATAVTPDVRTGAGVPADIVDDLRAHVQAHVPSYMVPLFHVMPRIPLSSNGKADTAKLRAALADGGAPGAPSPRGPATQLRKVLVDAVAELLGVSGDDAGTRSLALIDTDDDDGRDDGRVAVSAVTQLDDATVSEFVDLLLARMPGVGVAGAAVAESSQAPGPVQVPADVAADVRDLVAEVAGVPVAQVTAASNLQLELGANSLVVVRLHRLLCEEFSVQFDLMDLFSRPTVGDVAELVCQHLPQLAHAPGAASGAAPVAAALAPVPRPLGPAAASGEPFLVAVVGMACRLPRAETPAQLWAHLATGADLVTRPDGDAAGPVGSGGVINAGFKLGREHVRGFDHEFFRLSRHEASIMDPQQRLFLECCYEALEAGGYANATSVGVFSSTSLNTYLLNNLYNSGEMSSSTSSFVQYLITNDKDYTSARVAHTLDLRGPTVNVQTACSSTLVGLISAVDALEKGRCEVALAGGSSLSFPQDRGYVYEDGGIFSNDATCRPFDASAGGTVPGTGAGVVLLKPLAAAVRDGDNIVAVVRGGSVNNDGSSKLGFTAPNGRAQQAVIAAAHAAAGVTPASVSYVEAHGTATSLGDAIEVSALRSVFDDNGGKRVALGAVKSNVGHLDAAAGIMGVLKTCMALQRRQIPGTRNFTAPNPRLQLDASPFHVPASLSDWPAQGGDPRRAGVSSFGMGGTNAHVVFEEAPAPRQRTTATAPAPVLVPVSGHTKAALVGNMAKLLQHLEAEDGAQQSVADVAFTLQVGRRTLRHRWSCVAATTEELVAALREGVTKLSAPASDDDDDTRLAAPRVCFMFSGQGSQHVAMARDLHAREPYFAACVEECLAHMDPPSVATELRALLFRPRNDPSVAAAGGMERLKQTHLTQPALFMIEYALARLYLRAGLQPASLVGHSIGELVAAAVSGVMSVDVAVRVVCLRGRLMGSMNPGSMLAVTATEEQVRELLRRAPQLEHAVMNGTNANVLAGPGPAVAAAVGVVKAAGYRCRKLVTSHAFHTSMMQEAADALEAELAGARLSAPSMRYVSNVTGTWIEPRDAASAAYYGRQMRSTVRFADCLDNLAADGTTLMLEVGPGTTLTTLAKRHLRGREGLDIVSSLAHPMDSEADEHRMWLTALGKVWAAGANVEWQALHDSRKYADDARPVRVPLPTYAWQRVECFIDAQPRDGGAFRAQAHGQSWPSAALRGAMAPKGQRPSLNLEEAGSRAVAYFAGVLGILTADLDTEASFFDLGGSSLDMVTLLSKVKVDCGVNVTVREFHDNPTSAAFAELVQTRAGVVATTSASRRQAGELRAPPPRGDTLPLTFSQEHLWIFEQMAAGHAGYLVTSAFQVPKGFNITAIEWAYARLTERHEVLRTTFHTAASGTPCMVVHDAVSFPVITCARHSVLTSDVPELMHEVTQQPFDLETGPLVRLVHFSQRDNSAHDVLAVVTHHIVADGLSSRVLCRDLLAYSDAFEAGVDVTTSPPDLPALPWQFADFALWERQWASSAEGEANLAYWRAHLAHVPPLSLGTDLPRGTDMSFAGARAPVAWGSQLVAGVRALAKRLGSSTFTVLMAAYVAVLARHSRSSLIPVAVPSGGRLAETRDLIGNFVNTLVVAVEVGDNPTLQHLVGRVSATLADAMTHDMPLELLIKELKPKRTPGALPLAQVSLTFQPKWTETSVAGMAPLDIDPRTSHFDLELQVWEGADTIDGHMNYRTDLFTPATAAAIVQHITAVLEAACGAGDALQAPIRAIRMTTEAEEQALLRKWNPHPTPMRCLAAEHGGRGAEHPDNLLHNRVLKQCELRPNKTALTFLGSSMTYQQLNERSAALASHLSALGVGVGDIVGMHVPKVLEGPVVMMGILRCGAAYMPLDPSYPEERVRGIIEDSGTKVIVTVGSALVPLPPNSTARVVQVLAGGQLPLSVALNAAGVDPPMTAHEGAYVEYTSGSTGKPKGVKVMHLNACSMFDAAAEHFRPTADDVFSVYSSFSFDLSVYETFGALTYGGRTVVIPRDVSMSLEAFWRVVKDEGVSVIWYTPLAFEHFDQADQRLGHGANALTRLRLVVFAGDKLEPASLRSWFQRHGASVQLVNTYGTTETTVFSTIRWMTAADCDSPVSPFGYCLDNQRLLVLNEEREPVPPGVPGECWIAGECVAWGYLGRPDLTADRFRELRYLPGVRAYKTGDLVRYFTHAGGATFEFLGRVDHQVKIRGQRVELGEIESCLGANAAVAHAVVVVVGGKLEAFVEPLAPVSSRKRAASDDSADAGNPMSAHTEPLTRTTTRQVAGPAIDDAPISAKTAQAFASACVESLSAATGSPSDAGVYLVCANVEGHSSGVYFAGPDAPQLEWHAPVSTDVLTWAAGTVSAPMSAFLVVGHDTPWDGSSTVVPAPDKTATAVASVVAAGGRLDLATNTCAKVDRQAVQQGASLMPGMVCVAAVQVGVAAASAPPSPPSTAVSSQAPGSDAVAPARSGSVDAVYNPSLARALLDHARRSLPAYMVPRVHLVRVIPQSANGKANRDLLKQALPSVEREVAALAAAAGSGSQGVLSGMQNVQVASLDDETRERMRRDPTYVAPGDATELAVQRLWEEILDLPAVSMTADFFADLGGDSLEATALVAHLNSRLRRGEFPLARIFAASTPAAMAAVIRDSVDVEARGAKDAKEAVVVDLCKFSEAAAGSSRVGSLYFIHPAGGSALCYAHLAHQLRSHFDVHGIEDPGLYASDTTAYDSVEEMADAYVAGILQHTPAGPYVIAGFSYGGTVAVEVARRLMNAGHEVPAVAVLDTRMPGQPTTWRDDLNLIQALANHFASRRVDVSEEAVNLTPLGGLSGDALYTAAGDHLERFGILPPGGRDMVASFVTSYRAHEDLSRRFTTTPEPLPANVPLLYVCGTDRVMEDQRTWTSVSSHSEVALVPLPHHVMLDSSNSDRIVKPFMRLLCSNGIVQGDAEARPRRRRNRRGSQSSAASAVEQRGRSATLPSGAQPATDRAARSHSVTASGDVQGVPVRVRAGADAGAGALAGAGAGVSAGAGAGAGAGAVTATAATGGVSTRRVATPRSPTPLPVLSSPVRPPVTRLASAPSSVPLTTSQMGVWRREDASSGNPCNVVAHGFRVPGGDVAALASAYSAVLSRHATLHSSFRVTAAGSVMMDVGDPRTFPAVTPTRRSVAAADLNRAVVDAVRYPFSVGRGPLVRIHLYNVSGTDADVAVVTAHRLVCDEQSVRLLCAELAAELQGHPVAVPDAAVRFTDCAQWEASWLASEAGQAHAAYWKRVLAELPPLPLALDYERGQDIRFEGRRQAVSLDTGVVAGVNKLARALGVPLFSVIHAVLVAVLSRFSNCSDVAVAVPIANRTAETSNVVGCLGTTVVLRVDISDNPTVADLVQRVENVRADAVEHAIPFEAVVDAVKPKEVPGVLPLAQVCLSVEPEAASSVEEVAMDTESSLYDLSLHLVDGSDTLAGFVQYRTDLFSGDSVRRIVSWLTTALGSLASSADAPRVTTHGIRMTTTEQEAALMREWNSACPDPMRCLAAEHGGRGAEHPDNLLHNRVLKQCELHPDKVAVSCDGNHITYRQLRQRSEALAAHLCALGVGVGSIVGMHVPKVLEGPVVMMGILRCGAAYMPLDPSYPEERVRGIIEDSGTPVIVSVGDAVVPMPEGSTARIVKVLPGGKLPAGAATKAMGVDPPMTAHEGAYVEYTSGSTGKPKGVKVTHLNTCSMFESAVEHFRPTADDVFSVYCSFSFDLSVYETFGALTYGGRAVVITHKVALSPTDYWQVLKDEGVSVIWQTPLAFEALDHADRRLGVGANALTRLRLVIFCGDALEPPKLREWFQRHGDSVELVNVYGITETTVFNTIRWITEDDTDIKVSPIGLGIDNQRFMVLNEEQEPVPPGVPGECWIAGECVAWGYLGRPDLTADRFRELRYLPGVRAYKTGDLVRFIDRGSGGEFEFLGRVDHQVKIRGFRVELGEIEGVLLTHPAVEKATVLPPAKGWHLLYAFVAAPDVEVGQPAQALAEELMELCDRKLPGYMVPHQVQVITALPKSANGKLDKTALQRVIKEQGKKGGAAGVVTNTNMMRQYESV